MKELSLNQTQLALRWGLSPRTLERWRTLGWGPHFHKMGGRVIYKLSDIEAYEQETEMLSTSNKSKRKNKNKQEPQS